MSDYNAPNPFAPPRAAVDDGYTPEDSMVTAGRGARFGAMILDVLPYGAIGIVAAIAMPAYVAYTRSHGGSTDGSAGLAVVGGLAGLGLLAFMIYSASLVYLYGQTFGKKLMGIRVVRMDGSRVAFSRFFFLRYLPVALLSSIPVVGSIVALVDCVLIFRDSSRCLHDDIADTQVVTAASSPRATLAGSRMELPTIRY